MTLPFDAFLQQAWADHADHSAAVAERLRTDTPAPHTAEQLAALARLVVHLCGEHLGAFEDGRWRLAALAGHPLADATVQSTLRVGMASLTLAESGHADRDGFTLEELIRSEAGAAAISLGRHRTDRALALLRDARDRVAALPNAAAGVHRSLAVGCNNMAWELHDRGNARSAGDTAAMLDIAAASRTHWAQAGTWLEVERADYGLAMSHLSAGQADQGSHFAALCLAACVRNAAPPYEHFFAHEALAKLSHARGEPAERERHVAAAEALFERLAGDEQSSCRPTLTALLALAQ